MKKEKPIIFIIGLIALFVIVSIIIGQFCYHQSQILKTDDDLIAKLSSEVNINNIGSITIIDRVLQDDTALFWFVVENNYYAMNCEILGENKYRFAKIEELSYYTKDIVFTTIDNESFLINDERCINIQIIDNQTSEETTIPVETMPYVFRWLEYNKPLQVSLAFLDADGNDLHYK